MRTEHSHAITLYVDWFNQEQHPDFVAWADKGLTSGLASWCPSGQSHASVGYPDIFITLEPCLNGEGSDSDMPEAYWKQIVDTLREMTLSPKKQAIIVRLAPDQ